MICKICNNKFKTLLILLGHIKRIHKINSKSYYNKFFIKINEGYCLECNNPTNFINFSKGYRTYCSTKCKAISKVSQEKSKATCLKKYGVDNVSKNKEIKKKKIKTMNEHFGVDHHLKLNKQREKQKNTCLKKYGVANVSKNKEINNKRKLVFIEKYGVDNPFKNKDIKDKIKNTCIEKYGVEHLAQCQEVKNKIKNTFLNNREPIIKKNLDLLNLDLLSPFINGKSLIKIKCCKCDTIYETNYFNIYQGGGRCPNCYPKYRSIGEQEIVNFIKNLGFKTIENDRHLIKPLELDIYIQEKKIAIEYNGLYWHSEVQGKTRNYHLDKLKQCQEKGITLIQIFEDEWLFKQDIVKHRLLQILNVSDSTRIHARKCIIKEVIPSIKNEFLDKYHLQGKDNAKVKLGAFSNEELVSVMTFSKGNIAKGSKSKIGVWELNRFCSNYKYHIPGIASKLLTFFKRNYLYKQIFSYADRRWSQGNVYYKLGFSLEKETQPNYWYVKGLKRIHRFNLRKCPNEPRDIPESILRIQEGYTKIWDCGHLKFIINN